MTIENIRLGVYIDINKLFPWDVAPVFLPLDLFNLEMEISKLIYSHRNEMFKDAVK